MVAVKLHKTEGRGAINVSDLRGKARKAPADDSIAYEKRQIREQQERALEGCRRLCPWTFKTVTGAQGH